MATKNQVRAALRKKRKRGLLPPPECTNPRCKADLRDHNVPEEYAVYADMFGMAREIAVDKHTAVWQCPVCGHTWGKHVRLSPGVG